MGGHTESPVEVAKRREKSRRRLGHVARFAEIDHRRSLVGAFGQLRAKGKQRLCNTVMVADHRYDAGEPGEPKRVLGRFALARAQGADRILQK